MKHLKKFNEEYEIHVKDRNFYHISDLSLLKLDDYDIVLGYGLKMYVINYEYDIVEITKKNFKAALYGRWNKDKKPIRYFPYLMFLKFEHIKALKGIVRNLGELKKAQDEEIETRFKSIIYAVQNNYQR